MLTSDSSMSYGGSPTTEVAWQDSVLAYDLTFNDTGATGRLQIDLRALDLQPLDWGRSVAKTAIDFTGLENVTRARDALDTVKNRLEEISALRGDFGALQARLEAGRNVAMSKRENTRDAEQRIRGADVAVEAAELLRTQILQQSAAAVLSQANQIPELALSLLRL